MTTTQNNVTAALERLFARHTFGMKFDLAAEAALLRALDNPERDYEVIHVAGTNGKGSVCALLDSILRASGQKVGLYTSPHLVGFNERIRVDGCPIEDNELAALIEQTERLASDVAVEVGRDPTFFECGAAMAFEYFRRKAARIAVIETGMGGRLDATNVVTPLVSVITRIGVEHTSYLGDTIESIAFEKAGIIKTGRPVVCGAMDEKARDVIKRVASEKQARVVEAEQTVAIDVKSCDLRGQKVRVETADNSYGTFVLPLLGRHQLENLATAITAIELCNDALGLNIGAKNVKAGVSGARWPGRFQILSEAPLTILDGAHNPDAARALADTLKKVVRDRPLGLIVGMCSDKDAGLFLKILAEVAEKAWAVPIRSDRSMPAAQIKAIGEGAGLTVSEATFPKALAEAENWAREAGGAVCVTGSLFLVGEALEIRGIGMPERKNAV